MPLSSGAAGYYGSPGYLLGRTMNRSASSNPGGAADVSEEKGNVLKGNAYALLKKAVVNALALTMEIAGKTG